MMQSPGGKTMSKLPIVMLPHSPARTVRWQTDFPNRIGMFCGLETALSIPPDMPWALDNGRFAVWSAGKEWDQNRFMDLIDKALTKNRPPEWVVVPDEVGNAEKTFDEWHEWYPMLEQDPFDFKLALAVQDGMTPDSVKRFCTPRQPDVIFVGGTTRFKWRTLQSWCDAFPRVHVGRVNTERQLWMVQRAGAESSDGTGWFRGDPVNGEQVRQLRRYLTRSNVGLEENDAKGLLY